MDRPDDSSAPGIEPTQNTGRDAIGAGPSAPPRSKEPRIQTRPVKLAKPTGPRALNLKRVALAGLVLALAALGIYLATVRKPGPYGTLSASGTVEATEADLGVQVPGQLAWVRPHEGDVAKMGDTLAALDRSEFEARRAQALARLASAQALLREMEAGSRSEELVQAREADSAARARLTDAQRDFDRMQGLAQRSVVAQQSADKATLALDEARSGAEQARQQLQLVQKGPRQERIAAQRAAVAEADAAVRESEVTLAHAVVTAPFDGVVTIRHREPGEATSAGAPILTIVNLADRWVRIYVSENRIGAIRLGAPATITTDTYRGKPYEGAVSFIASEAEFTPRNVQTTEERVKLVYAIKVRITGDPEHDLKPGMPADVQLRLPPPEGRPADGQRHR